MRDETRRAATKLLNDLKKMGYKGPLCFRPEGIPLDEQVSLTGVSTDPSQTQGYHHIFNSAQVARTTRES